MVKRFLATVFYLFIVISAYTQQWKLKRMEGIFGVGTANVYSDLGGAPNAANLLFIKDITFRTTRPSAYAGVRYRIDPRTTAKVSLIYGYSKTEDYSGSRNENRGFSSITQLVEFAANYEYYFLPEQRRMRSAAIFNRRGMVNDYLSFAAYVFIGIGSTFYWPHLELSEKRPGDHYKNNMGVTASLPIGIGFKYIISDKWIFGYEIGYRQTISDYLDGFKSPSSKRPDVYWISTFNLSYRIATSRRGLPMFMDKRWKRIIY
jgi:OmpA-OmpF porin, OOP family